MNRAPLSLGVLLVGLSLACNHLPDPSVSRTALMEADRSFAAATAAQRVDGWVAFFAPDGKMVTGRGTIEGTSAIRAHMAPYFADSSATLTWAPRSAEASGDLGYTVGRYEAKRRIPTGVTRETGTYVTIWRRGPDGRWQVALDIGNPDQ